MFGFRIIGIRTGVAVLGVGRREGVVTVRKHVVSVGRITSVDRGPWTVQRAACARALRVRPPTPWKGITTGYGPLDVQ